MEMRATKLKRRWDWRYGHRSEKGRITIVNQFFPPDFAATGQLLNQLSQGIVDGGFKTHILTGMPAYAFSTLDAERLEFDDGRCIRRTSASRLWPKQIKGRAINGILFILRTLLRLMRRSRRSQLVIWTTEPPYMPIIAWIVSFITRTPYILILYDIYPDVLFSLKILREKSLLVKAWKLFNKLSYINSKGIVVLSEPMKSLVVREYCADDNKVTIIPSWSDPAHIKPLDKSDNWFVAKHNLHNKFVVMYSGNMGRCHDLVTIVGAALILRAKSEIVFMFIGNGPQKDRVRKLKEDLELDNIILVPYQEYCDIPFTLAAADLSIVSIATGLDSVVAPSKLYGHLAAGSPVAVIAPENCYLKKLVEEVGCGAWFSNGDSLRLSQWVLEIRSNKKERLSLGQKGRNHVLKEACPEVVFQKYLDLINKCRIW